MKLAIKHHTLIDLLDIGGEVQKASEAMLHGSWAARNPLAGKMTRCPFCNRRTREGVRKVIPCCSGKVAKEFAPVVGGGMKFFKQMLGAKQFAGKRKHPHRNAKKLQINEWRLRFEQSEEAMKKAQAEMRGLSGFWTPQFNLGKGNAASLAEQYVLFLLKKKAKSLRTMRNGSLFANRESRSTYAQDMRDKQSMKLRKNWRKEKTLEHGLGRIETLEFVSTLRAYPHRMPKPSITVVP